MVDTAEIEYAKAAYLGSCALQQAASATRIAIASYWGKCDELTNALVGSYLRAGYWMDSIVRLNKYPDCQAILHGVRCIYESQLDLVDLIAEPSLLPRLHAFHFISNFAAGEKLTAVLDAHLIPGVPGDDAQRQFILDADNRNKYDTLRETYWGRNPKGKLITPTHWHRLRLAERAKAR